MNKIEDIEAKYGPRFMLPVGHGETLAKKHWRGEDQDGDKFVYCPEGFLLSWHPEDYNHRYCPWCKEYF